MTIRGTTIKPVPSHKFLGVIVDQELRWREHTAYAIAKGASHAMLLRPLSSLPMVSLLNSFDSYIVRSPFPR